MKSRRPFKNAKTWNDERREMMEMAIDPSMQIEGNKIILPEMRDCGINLAEQSRL
jgi:hypothetical protein